MELWNDYEGKMVDGRYRLDRLVAPKGRSALFQTTDESGAPAMIRLIESLNDEAEILRRWNAVRVLKDEHLTQLFQCGETVLDGVHLVYALMEPFDAELSEILKERPLTGEEAKEVAGSVASALEQLHAHGLVHEHVESSQVVARGEVVKLRSDLVREAGEGAEAAAMRRRDAHDLAVLIQETVTRRRESGAGTLPAPLEEMVRNGRSGAWGVGEMAAVLRPAPGSWANATNGASRSGAAPAGEASARPVTNGASGMRPVAAKPAVQGRAGAAAIAAGAALAAGTAGAAAREPGTAAATPPRAGAAAATEGARAPLVRDRIVIEPEEAVPQKKWLWGIAAAGLLGAILLFWHFLHGGKQPAGAGPVVPTPAAATAVNPPPTAVASGVPAPVRSGKPSAARTGRDRPGLGATSAQAAAAPAARSATTAETASAAAGTAPHDAHSAWRVVAFTYNREDQAQHKVEAITQQHPDLQPEVFAPKGGSPYLVALGGWMSSTEAAALRDRARSEGLPRDTYTQNFRNH